MTIAVHDWKWTISWGRAALALGGMALFSTLGFWQLSRHAEKSALLATRQVVVDLPSTFLARDLQEWRLVQLSGQYLPERQFLVDNVVFDGRVGYEVVTPFSVPGLGVALIRRGWLPADSSRSVLPAINTPGGFLTLQARVRADGQKKPPLFGPWAEDAAGWPLRTQFMDSHRMEQRLGIDLAVPGWLDLLPRQPGSYTQRRVLAGLKPEKHLAYATQWFSFAFVVLVLFVIFSLRRSAEASAHDTGED